MSNRPKKNLPVATAPPDTAAVLAELQTIRLHLRSIGHDGPGHYLAIMQRKQEVVSKVLDLMESDCLNVLEEVVGALWSVNCKSGQEG